MTLPPALGIAALDTTERAALIHWLGDSPFTALTVGQLKHGSCRAYAIGGLVAPKVAIVHTDREPTEPIAFGHDVDAIWTLLSRIPGWDCVNVAPEIAAEVARLFERKLGAPARLLSERYYSLEREPRMFKNPNVRSMGSADAELVRRSNPLFASYFVGHGGVSGTLTDGVVAGAVIDGRLASAVTTSAWVGNHVDLGAATVPELRGRGLATAAACVVACQLRDAGRTPVWAAGEPNRASWSVPDKLGFRFVGRREYVVFEGLRPDGFLPS